MSGLCTWLCDVGSMYLGLCAGSMCLSLLKRAVCSIEGFCSKAHIINNQVYLDACGMGDCVGLTVSQLCVINAMGAPVAYWAGGEGPGCQVFGVIAFLELGQIGTYFIRDQRLVFSCKDSPLINRWGAAPGPRNHPAAPDALIPS